MNPSTEPTEAPGTRASLNRPVFVVGRFPPPRDGQSLATERLAEMLSSRFDVLRFNTEPPDAEILQAVPRFRVDRALHFIRVRGRLKKALRAYPDAPVLWASISSSLPGHLRDRLTVLPAFGRGHAVMAVSHRANLHERFLDARTRTTMGHIARRVDRFVLLTEEISDALAAWIPDRRRVVVPNTIAEALRFTPEEVTAKQAERAARSEIRLLFLSNLLPEKGWKEVLEAVPLCRAAGIPLQARFAGRWTDPSDRAWFDRFVEDHDLGSMVEHLGAIAVPKTIRDLHLQADVLLLPTYYPVEAMPLVILEAFSAGTPVIGTSQGGLSEMILDGENGIRVPPRDAGAIARAIGTLVDPERWLEMSRGARETFMARYDEEAVLKQWVDLIEPARAESSGE